MSSFVALYAGNPQKIIDMVDRHVVGVSIIPFGDMEKSLKTLTYKNIKLNTLVILGNAFAGKSHTDVEHEFEFLKQYILSSPTTTVTFLHSGELSDIYIEVLGQFTQCIQYVVSKYSTRVIEKLLYLEDVDVQGSMIRGNNTSANLASDALKDIKVQKDEVKEPLFAKKAKKKTMEPEPTPEPEQIPEPEPTPEPIPEPEPPKKVKYKVQKPVKEKSVKERPVKEKPDPIIEEEVEELIPKKKDAVKNRFIRGIVLVTGDRRSGKSTVSKLVAEEYAKRGLQTIIIDLNYENRMLSQCFGDFGYRAKCRNGLYFSTLNPNTIDENILPITESLYYLGTSETLDPAEERHLKSNLNENLFSSLIQVASKLYDVVIVDCPFDVLKRNQALLNVCTTVLWTSDCNNSGIKMTLDLLLHQFYEDEREYNFFLSKLVIVLNNDIETKAKSNWIRYYNQSDDSKLEMVCEKLVGIVPHIPNYDKKFWKSETETVIVKVVEPFLNSLL